MPGTCRTWPGPGATGGCPPGPIKALRLPVALPAVLRFPSHRRYQGCTRVSLPARLSAATPGLELFTRYLQPGFPWRRQGLPRSWGTPMCLCPALRPRQVRSHPTTRGASTRPPLKSKRRLLQLDSFRGSITRLQHSLSTLRREGRPSTTQDSLPAAGQALPDGFGYPQGSCERFRGESYISSSFPKLSWRKIF